MLRKRKEANVIDKYKNNSMSDKFFKLSLSLQGRSFMASFYHHLLDTFPSFSSYIIASIHLFLGCSLLSLFSVYFLVIILTILSLPSSLYILATAIDMLVLFN